MRRLSGRGEILNQYSEMRKHIDVAINEMNDKYGIERRISGRRAAAHKDYQKGVIISIR